MNRVCITLTAVLFLAPIALCADANEPNLNGDSNTASISLLRKQAQQGNAKAQYNLGLMYNKGQGVPQDYKQALIWYTKAAEQGYAEAQFNLGGMYHSGEGVPQDYKKALIWFTRAAQQGLAKAQYNLGSMYYHGEGVAEDYVEAYKWCILAAAQGEKVAVDTRDNLKTSMTPSQIAEAQRLARNFKPRPTPPPAAQQPAPDMPGLLSRELPRSSATGFFITADGLIITANHAVKDAVDISILTVSGLKKAAVVRRDSANDIALLKAQPGPYTPLPLAASAAVKLGQDVLTIGFPNIQIQGFEPKFTKGSISSLTGIQDDPRYFQISVPIQPGNSGGPLMDSIGNVIGIVTSKLPDIDMLVLTGQLPENVGYAVRSSYALGLLETLPEVSKNLKPPNTRKLTQVELVEQSKKSVVLVLSY